VPGEPDLSYFAVGGRDSDTTFTSLTKADPTKGPFESYD
jgi:hypothetical protein